MVVVDVIGYYRRSRSAEGDEFRAVTPTRFRFGASSLANDVLMQLQKQATGVYQSADYFSKD